MYWNLRGRLISDENNRDVILHKAKRLHEAIQFFLLLQT